MVIGKDTIYSYSCNKQKDYDATKNVYDKTKYLFSMDIFKDDSRDSVVSLNFSSLADIVKLRDCLNAFLKFSEEMVD